MSEKAAAKKQGKQSTKRMPSAEAEALKRFKALLKKNAGKHRFAGCDEWL